MSNPHKQAPKQCPTNTFSFTDSSLVADVTKVRDDHIQELRAQVAAECVRRGLSAPPTYIDPIIYPSTSPGRVKLRNDHITSLRTQIERIHVGDSEPGYCPEDTFTPSWTDTLTAGVVKWRNNHVTELRVAINALKSGCICETEYCQYCADCGYSHSGCSHAGVACDNHKYSECSYAPWTHHHCGSTNLAVGTVHPYKAVAADEVPTKTAWDGYIPWEWCVYAPPGVNWGSCYHEGGNDHSSDWTCKCNPFTW